MRLTPEVEKTIREARIRTEGIGSNFSVLNPHDGYRKNDQLWFGTCAQCCERVTSSRHDGNAWMHRLVIEKGVPLGMSGRGDTTRQIDYCPKAGESSFKHL